MTAERPAVATAIPAPVATAAPVATSGKWSIAAAVDELPQFDFEDEREITQVAAGWRLERNSNGYYRWRWQMKDATGQPLTYVATSGKSSYRRGSQYVSIREAEDRERTHDHADGEPIRPE